MKIRPEVQLLVGMGPMLDEDSEDLVWFEQFQQVVEKISAPVTDDEATMLLNIFGPDGCFGLAWAVVHLIETAPGWPIVDALISATGIWADELRDRCRRSGLRP